MEGLESVEKANADIYVIKTAPRPCRCSNRLYAARCLRPRSVHQTTATDIRPRHRLAGMAYACAVSGAHAVLTQNQTDRDNRRNGWPSKPVIPNGHHLPPPDRNPRTTILWVGRSA